VIDDRLVITRSVNLLSVLFALALTLTTSNEIASG